MKKEDFPGVAFTDVGVRVQPRGLDGPLVADELYLMLAGVRDVVHYAKQLCR